MFFVFKGPLAHLVERLFCKEEVSGSSPLGSTRGPLAHLVERTHGMGEVTGSSPVRSTLYANRH